MFVSVIDQLFHVQTGIALFSFSRYQIRLLLYFKYTKTPQKQPKWGAGCYECLSKEPRTHLNLTSN